MVGASVTEEKGFHDPRANEVEAPSKLETPSLLHEQVLTPQPQRLETLQYVVILQIVGCVLVVLGHSYPYEGVPPWADTVRRFIYTFHMPLFVWCSGFLAVATSAATKYRFGEFLRKRATRLLVPYAAFSVIGIAPKVMFASVLHDQMPLNGGGSPNGLPSAEAERLGALLVPPNALPDRLDRLCDRQVRAAWSHSDHLGCCYLAECGTDIAAQGDAVVWPERCAALSCLLHPGHVDGDSSTPGRADSVVGRSCSSCRSGGDLHHRRNGRRSSHRRLDDHGASRARGLGRATSQHQPRRVVRADLPDLHLVVAIPASRRDPAGEDPGSRLRHHGPVDVPRRSVPAAYHTTSGGLVRSPNRNSCGVPHTGKAGLIEQS